MVFMDAPYNQRFAQRKEKKIPMAEKTFRKSDGNT